MLNFILMAQPDTLQYVWRKILAWGASFFARKIPAAGALVIPPLGGTTSAEKQRQWNEFHFTGWPVVWRTGKRYDKMERSAVL